MIARTLCAAIAILFLAAGQTDIPRQISESGKGAYEASLTVFGKQLAAAWYDTRDGHAEIYFRLLDAAGRPAGPERRLTNGTDFAYEPDIAALGDTLAVAWYERNPGTTALRAKLALVSRDGRVLWLKTLSPAGHEGRNPVVRVVGGEVLCAWLQYPAGQSPEVWAEWFDAKGQPLVPPQRVAPAGRTTWNLNAAVDSRGRAWLTFDATAGTRSDELFLALVGKTTSRVVRLTRDDGVASKYPDLSFSGDRAALTWFDEHDGNEEVYLQVAPVDALTESSVTFDGRARRVTQTPGESIGAYVTWNGRRIGLAWCDNSEGQHEIFVQQFDADGAALDTPERLTHNPTHSLIPAIRPWRDGFALVWNEFMAGRGGPHSADGRSEVWFAFVGKSDK
jgi:hypothetical protein